MPTLEELLEKRSALISQIASAEQSVATDGFRAEFRDVGQNEKALAILDAEINRLSAAASSPRIFRTRTSKGV